MNRPFVGALLLAFTLAHGAQAETRPTEDFGDDNPTCIDWTDGCIVCEKQPDGAPACSTPGIACEQSAAHCLKDEKETPSSHK